MMNRSEAFSKRDELLRRFMEETACQAAGFYHGVIHDGEQCIRYHAIQVVGDTGIIDAVCEYEARMFSMNFEIDDQSRVNSFGVQVFSELGDSMKSFGEYTGILSATSMSVEYNGIIVGWFGGWRKKRDSKTDFLDKIVESSSKMYWEAICEIEQREMSVVYPGRALLLFDGEANVFSWNSDDGDLWLRGFGDDLNSMAVSFLSSRLGYRYEWVPGAAVKLYRVFSDDRVGVIAEIIPVIRAKVPPLAMLTPTQQKIARLFVEGATDQEIAKHMSRSVDTIRTHRKNIYKKLGIGCRAELVSAVVKLWS